MSILDVFCSVDDFLAAACPEPTLNQFQSRDCQHGTHEAFRNQFA